MSQTDNDDAVVVYYFADPAYHGDMTSTLVSLKKRGFRIVKGDNADELLFLLQVGRPAAVIYTLAFKESKSSAGYQMVTRRAIDLLVPLILLGPDEPRDGAMLLYPHGSKVTERHIPYHIITDLISQFDSQPPSTRSRPPSVLHEQTIGKGRTILNWRGGSSLSQPPAEVKSSDSSDKSDESDKSAELDNEGFDIKSTSKMFKDSNSRLKQHKSDESKIAVESAPEAASISLWKIIVGVVAVVALVVFVLINTFVDMAKGSRVNKQQSFEGPVKHVVSSDTSIVVSPVADKEMPKIDIPDNVSKQREKHRPLKDVDDKAAMPFPAHFRQGSAIFWFSNSRIEGRFMELLHGRPSTKIKIVGHSTNEESIQGKGALGLSRAWAVEKYLIRKGFKDEDLETVAGPPVNGETEIDENKQNTNFWVDIIIE